MSEINDQSQSPSSINSAKQHFCPSPSCERPYEVNIHAIKRDSLNEFSLACVLQPCARCLRLQVLQWMVQYCNGSVIGTRECGMN